jgi:AcrR family transcriptional regulator
MPAVTRTYRGLTADQRAADRRARLVAAGRRAFAGAGYAATTIEALCRAANVTARHFYEHFASREALLLAVYEEVLEGHRGAVARGLADAPEDTLEPRVRAAIAAAVGAWTADRGTARIAFIEVVGVSATVEARRLQAVDEYTEARPRRRRRPPRPRSEPRPRPPRRRPCRRRGAHRPRGALAYRRAAARARGARRRGDRPRGGVARGRLSSDVHRQARDVLVPARPRPCGIPARTSSSSAPTSAITRG